MNIFTRLYLFFILGPLLGMGCYLSLINPGWLDSISLLLGISILLPVLGFWIFGCILIHFFPTPLQSFVASIEWMIEKKRTKYGLYGVLLLGSCLFLVSLGTNIRRLPPSSTRLFVFGLDGATWNLINPWIESGDLPNIQSLCQQGARGNLQSLEPMQSPDLWTSIATGVPAEIHGIQGYFKTRTDLKAYRIWDIAHQQGLKVGLFSWLLSWPPADPFAFLIPSWMSRSPETVPSDMSCFQELYLEQSRYGGPVHPFRSLWQCLQNGARLGGVDRMMRFYLRDGMGFSEEARLAAKLMAESRLETDQFLTLMRRYQPDVATFTLYGTDKISHRFWHYMEPEEFPTLSIPQDHPDRHVIRDYYRQADHELGRILQILPRNCHIVLISDHGFKADPNAPRQFFLDVPKLLHTLQASHWVYYYTIERQVILEAIIPENSILDTLKKELEAIRFSNSDEPVFQVEIEDGKRIHLRTSFSLSWNEESPLLTQTMLDIGEKSYPTEEFFFVRTFSGTHDPQGIIVAKGPAIITGSVIENANLLDIAPTLLYLLDLPISQELPGRVLSEIMADEYQKEHAAHYVQSYGVPPAFSEDTINIPETLMENLRSLDYVK